MKNYSKSGVRCGKRVDKWVRGAWMGVGGRLTVRFGCVCVGRKSAGKIRRAVCNIVYIRIYLYFIFSPALLHTYRKRTRDQEAFLFYFHIYHINKSHGHALSPRPLPPSPTTLAVGRKLKMILNN